jgi:hypothetical protein
MRLFLTRAARPGRALCLIPLAIAIAACSNDTTGPSNETPAETATITVDAATATAFVSLGTQLRVVAGADSASGSAWDISVNATTIKLNATGGVSAHCACVNESATDAAVMAMTADAQRTPFDAVSAADIPAATSFAATTFDTHKWYRYNLTGTDHQIWPTFNVYLVKRGSAVYKVQITNYYGANGAPRQITLRSALLRN